MAYADNIGMREFDTDQYPCGEVGFIGLGNGAGQILACG